MRGRFNREGLLRLGLNGDKVVLEVRIGLQNRIRDLIEAPDGSVWVLTDYKERALLRLSAATK